jgi:acetyltransferase-like isoleucine patch superfamily enzyme
MIPTLETAVLRLKRGDGRSYQLLRRVHRYCVSANLPVPEVVKPLGRLIYNLQLYARGAFKRVCAFLCLQPLFRSRCDSLGKRLSLIALPRVVGHASIVMGDDVRLSGTLGIVSGRTFDNPVLRIGNRVFLGHDVEISCNREIVIEDDVMIAGCCRISDNDGHSVDMERRIKGLPPEQSEVHPVRICRGAWIGFRSFILKGVTVGEGAVIGANSVVTRDVPPHTVVAGSPARVVMSIPTQEIRIELSVTERKVA